MAKREFLLLAQTYEPAKHGIGGWFMSEKLDGIRAFWDGGISRGMLTTLVPFANVEKDGRYIEQPHATGLWSRYGKAIQAPNDWLDTLPPFPLDGELYLGRQCFQELGSTVKQLKPDHRWRDVRFKVFDIPPVDMVFADGVINNPNMKKTFMNVNNWARERMRPPIQSFFAYEQALNYLRKHVNGPHAEVHEQRLLDLQSEKAVEEVEAELERIHSLGGEGLMLRRRMSVWSPHRTYDLLKVKKMQDMEVTIVGYKWGRETDKGSKLLGLMGSARCKMDNGKEFDLSGFTEEERIMTESDTTCPGEVVMPFVENRQFPRGTRITILYRELTNDGLPKEARYYRKRPTHE